MNRRDREVKLNTLIPRERARKKPSSVNVKIPHVHNMVSPSIVLEKIKADQIDIAAMKINGEKSRIHLLNETLPKIKVAAAVITKVRKGVTGSKKTDRINTQTMTVNALMLGLNSCKNKLFPPCNGPDIVPEFF